MSQFHLDAASASGAITALVSAANRIATSNASRPRGGFESVTGIAADVDLYLRGVSVARASLADAALTAGHSVRDLMDSATELDSGLASSLGRDFALKE